MRSLRNQVLKGFEKWEVYDVFDLFIYRMAENTMKPLFDPEKVTFVEEGHEYYVEVDGETKQFPALTHVLRACGLGVEYDKAIPESVLEKARIRGTSVHKAVENHINGKPWEVDELHTGYVDRGIALLGRHRMSAQMVERPLFNPVFEYCTMPDFVGLVDGRLGLVDWKTTSKINWKTGFQLAGQALCFRNPEAFKLYVGDLKNGILQPVPDPDVFLRVAREAFQVYNEVQDMEELYG
jgi:hypothetical protein